MSSNSMKELIKQEYKKCAASEDYFLNKYCSIQHPQKGKIPFQLYQYQRNAIKDFHDHDYNIILKGRQIGISTVIAGHCLHKMIFKRDMTILLIATQKDKAKNLITKIKFMNDNLPAWLRGKYVENNKMSIKFTTGSQSTAVASNEKAVRSESLSLLIFDECAFIEDPEPLWTAAQATLATGGTAILVSTPNGVGNFFHQTWQKAISGENGFHPIFLDWKVHPERDQAWRDRQTELLGELQAHQEHDASFIFSGNTVVGADILDYYKTTHVRDPIDKQAIDGNLWIWEHTVPGKSYIACADVARGDGDDYSTIHVIDTEASIQVAEYKGKMSTKDFGNLMVDVATTYNNALLIPDNSSIGWSAIQQVIDRKYENLFYMSKDLQYVDNSKMMNDGRGKNMVAGFTISSRTRPLIIAKLEEYMRDKSIVIRSSRTMAEFDTFIWKNGRAEALQRYNDDLVMALGIGLWVRDTALRLRLQGIEMIRTSLLNTSYISSPMMKRSTSHSAPDPYVINVTGDIQEDVRWLLDN